MIGTLGLRGFRGFDSYRLADLARVNLLVGKNDSGKTSVLEAVELLVTEGNLRVLYESLRRRGDMSARFAQERLVTVSHVFHGHSCEPGASFDLSTDDCKRSLSATMLSSEEIDEELDDWYLRLARRQRRTLSGSEEVVVPASGLSIDSGVPEKSAVFPVLEDGALMHDLVPGAFRRGQVGTPVHFLTLESFDPAAMDKMWSMVVMAGREAEVVQDMQLLEPDLDSIHFLPTRVLENRIVLGKRNGGRRYPIRSYGDGIRRLLALRLAFVGSADGVLLVDEIDTGLHWTVMRGMWSMVVQLAENLNVQVFATTHSYDCVRALGSLLRSRPEFDDQVTIQKLDRRLPQAVGLEGDQIKIAVQQDIEVR